MLEVRDDSAAAFEELVSRYQGRLVTLFRHLLGNHEQAEDLAQEVFLRVYRARDSYRPGAKFATWLFTIASNLCRNRLRYRRYHPVYSPPEEMSGGGDPAVVVSREDRWARIRRGLDRLPAAYRAPIVLRYYNDLSYQEIAEVLSLPEGTVKTRLHRGKALLKQAIEENGVMQHERG